MKTNIILFLILGVLVIAGVVVVYLHYHNKTNPNPNPNPNPGPSPSPGPAPSPGPGPSPTPSDTCTPACKSDEYCLNGTCKKNVTPGSMLKGAWAGGIGCGDQVFDIISLASALPQQFYHDAGGTQIEPTLDTFFSQNIPGTYRKDLSSGKTTYVISIGGSAASPSGWKYFFQRLQDPNEVNKFVDSCKCRGLAGVDFDLEQTTKDNAVQLNTILTNMKKYDPNFKVMLTILLGSPDTFASLLDNPNNYDYLSLMLYNGGMYSAAGTGAGCDWDQWAELILSQGKTGCDTPLKLTTQQYAQQANLAKVNPSKVLLGLITDADHGRLTADMVNRAYALINQYKAAGYMIWVIPGWVEKDNVTYTEGLFNLSLGSACSAGTSCPQLTNPCVANKSSTCSASACAKKNYAVTDDSCKPCATGQTYWPCDQAGYCQDGASIPPLKCE